MCEMEAEVKVTNLLPFSGRLYFAIGAGALAMGEALDLAFAFFTLCDFAGLADASPEATAAEAEATGADAAGADAFGADATF